MVDIDYERERMQKKRCIRDGIPCKISESLPDLSESQLVAARYIVKQLSIGFSPHIEKVDDSCIVPKLVKFLGGKESEELQLESAWALANIASGTSDHTKVVMESGAMPIFLELLASASDGVCQQAMRALGNIASNSLKFRNRVLDAGALDKLRDKLRVTKDTAMFQNAAWALSNFCRGKPQLSYDQTVNALKSLHILIQSNDEQVLEDACWTLSYLSDGTNSNIQAVIKSDVCLSLVKLLKQGSSSLLVPVLRTIGNIATGDDEQIHYIIKLGVLPCLLKLLEKDYDKTITKEACRTISSITAGNKDHIQEVIDADIIRPLVHLLQNSESDIKEEAAWAILNATSFGTYTQIQYLVQCGCAEPLCSLLICSDPRIVTVCLEGLENILKSGEPQKDMAGGDVNQVVLMIEASEEFKKIKNLLFDENEEIRMRATKLIDTYWEKDDHVTPHGDMNQPGFGYEGVNSVPAGIHKCGGTIIGTSRGGYDNQKIVNSFEENQDNSMGVENCLKTFNTSADSVLGRIEAQAKKDEEITAASTGEVKKYKKKKKMAVTDKVAAPEDAGKKKDKKKKHVSEVAVEVQEENGDKKKKKRKHVKVDEAEPEVEKSTKKKKKNTKDQAC